MNDMPASEPGEGAWRRRYSLLWPPVLAAILILAAWELSIWLFKLPNFLLPTPQEILVAAIQDRGQVLHDTWATLVESLVGYVAGSVLGLGIALLFVTFPRVERALLPAYVTINSVPMVAYGPLAIIWLGIGASSKITLIIIAVSYSILINALAGLRSCDPGAISLLRTFGASERTILLKLRLPTAMPAIFSGLRVAVVHAMILAVVLEMLGAREGLGWTVFKSTQMMDFVAAWVAVGATVIVSLAIYSVVSWIGHKLVWW